MLDQLRRWWASIEPTLGRRPVFAVRALFAHEHDALALCWGDS